MIKKIEILIFTFFMFNYCLGQTNKYFIAVLNQHLHSTALNFDPCENVTISGSYILDASCKHIISHLPMRSLLIQGGTDINIETKTLYFYVELKCLNDEGCIFETGSSENWTFSSLRYSFLNKPDEEKAFKILIHLQSLIKK